MLFMFYKLDCHLYIPLPINNFIEFLGNVKKKVNNNTRLTSRNITKI